MLATPLESLSESQLNSVKNERIAGLSREIVPQQSEASCQM
jgi:hypothetical protein